MTSPAAESTTGASGASFAGPWQDFITRTAWGEIWGDPTLPWKTRSMITLAMMVALHREEEFKLHVRPALKNGVTLDELRALLLQAAIYAGVPAANTGGIPGWTCLNQTMANVTATMTHTPVKATFHSPAAT